MPIAAGKPGQRGSGRPERRGHHSVVAVRDDIELMDDYHSPQVDVAVRLNTNESPFPPPAGWVEAIAEQMRTVAFHRYPDRRAWALREAIARHHGVRPEEVFCANGSNEVIQCLLLAFGGQGRTAAMFEPTYALHSHISRITSTRIGTGERQPDFSLDMKDVERVMGAFAPEVTFLCSPNNPTGRAEPEGTVREVLELAPGLVVVDEAYGQFASWSALSLRAGSNGPRSDANDRMVVVRTFSKTWSMAAFRLGYLVAAVPVVSALEKVALPYHLDAVKQLAGQLALEHQGDMEVRVAMIIKERDRLEAALCRLPVEVWPSDANFILFRPTRKDGAEVWRGLLERSVLVRDCSSWPRLQGCLRVTVGTPAENAAFLEAIGACLR